MNCPAAGARAEPPAKPSAGRTATISRPPSRPASLRRPPRTANSGVRSRSTVRTLSCVGTGPASRFYSGVRTRSPTPAQSVQGGGLSGRNSPASRKQYPGIAELSFEGADALEDKHLLAITGELGQLKTLRITGAGVANYYSFPQITNRGLNAVLAAVTVENLVLSDLHNGNFDLRGLRSLPRLKCLSLGNVRCDEEAVQKCFMGRAWNPSASGRGFRSRSPCRSGRGQHAVLAFAVRAGRSPVAGRPADNAVRGVLRPHWCSRSTTLWLETGSEGCCLRHGYSP